MRTQIESAIAHHYGVIGPRDGIEIGGVCDSYVLGGGVSQVMRQGSTAGSLNMPFFLQMVGAGPTTAALSSLSAVLTHAQWPTITCHELYEHHLLTGAHSRHWRPRPGARSAGSRRWMDENVLEQYRVDNADHTHCRGD